MCVSVHICSKFKKICSGMESSNVTSVQWLKTKRLPTEYASFNNENKIVSNNTFLWSEWIFRKTKTFLSKGLSLLNCNSWLICKFIQGGAVLCVYSSNIVMLDMNGAVLNLDDTVSYFSIVCNFILFENCQNIYLDLIMNLK